MGIAAAETVIAWQSHEGLRISQAAGLDVIDCAMCGFRHVVPLPDARALEAIYRETYYRDEKPTFLSHAGEDQDWAELAQNDRLEVERQRAQLPDRRSVTFEGAPGGNGPYCVQGSSLHMIGLDLATMTKVVNDIVLTRQ